MCVCVCVCVLDFSKHFFMISFNYVRKLTDANLEFLVDKTSIKVMNGDASTCIIAIYILWLDHDL